MAERRRLTWFILIRLVVAGILFASTTFLYWKKSSSIDVTVFNGIVTLTLLTFSLCILLLLVVRRSTRHFKLLIYFQLVWDLQYVTILIILTGGIVSPYSFLYLIIIIGVSISLSRHEAFLCASLCSIVYGALLDLQYYGRLFNVGPDFDLAQQFEPLHVLYTIFINVLAFFLTAFLSGYLAGRAQASEQALHKKEVDYEELKRLNSAIVASLDSGVITLNELGRVRVFNRYAEDFFKVPQKDAYDALLAEVSPYFAGISTDGIMLTREEIVCVGPDGKQHVLGYKSVPLFDLEGQQSGIVINFKDLSEIKRLEERLKRADRLAAIGELSSRIAHEIRNPLAAISGSVQLISQGGGIPSSDMQLLTIVLRETQRLNVLITDFLSYARPSTPAITFVRIEQLIEEMILLIKQDQRFEAISVLTDCEPSARGTFDPELMKQVLWNLLLNAADSCGFRGTIEIRVHGMNDQRGGVVVPGTCFVVADNGAGMSPDVLQRVFEPFYTTKVGGSGLGLATVYRIVEAHGGSVDVQSSLGTGARFTLWIPQIPSEGGEQA